MHSSVSHYIPQNLQRVVNSSIPWVVREHPERYPFMVRDVCLSTAVQYMRVSCSHGFRYCVSSFEVLNCFTVQLVLLAHQHQFINLSIHPSIHTSIYPYICPFIYSPIYLSIYLSFYLSQLPGLAGEVGVIKRTAQSSWKEVCHH